MVRAIVVALALALASPAAAFLPARSLAARSVTPARVTQLRMSANELAATQAELSNKIGSTLGLKLTDYTQTMGMERWANGGDSGVCQWFDEASPQFLNGLSVCSTTAGGATKFQLNGWVSPSFEVPHMLTTLTATAAGIEVRLDYVARDDLAYCGGAYMESYFGNDVTTAWTSAMSQGTPLPPVREWQGRLLESNAAIAVLVPDAATAIRLVTAHVDRWLGWLASAQPIIARRRGAMNGRDDGVRRIAYEFEVESAIALVGRETGINLGAAVIGPISEAYVGGGS